MFAGGKKEEAIAILEKAAKHNGLPTKNIRTDVTEYLDRRGDPTQVDNRKGNILDLIRTPIMRMYTVAICFNWLVCGLCFFGVSQFIGHLGGTKHFLRHNIGVTTRHFYRKYFSERGSVRCYTASEHFFRLLGHKSLGTQKYPNCRQCTGRDFLVFDWFCSRPSHLD